MGMIGAERRLTPAQLRKIWASARELGWDDGKLHQELERVIGVISLRELTLPDAKLFIDFLVSEGASSGSHRSRSAQVDGGRRGPCPANVIELATPAQQEYVDDLLRGLGWTRRTDYFLGALKKATGRTVIRTRREASVAIEILKDMTARFLGTRPESASQGEDQVNGGCVPPRTGPKSA